MTYYSIARMSPVPGGTQDTSTLAEDNGALRVMGNLRHGYRIEPATVDEARRLIDWLIRWTIERTIDEAQTAAGGKS